MIDLCYSLSVTCYMLLAIWIFLSCKNLYLSLVVVRLVIFIIYRIQVFNGTIRPELSIWNQNIPFRSIIRINQVISIWSEISAFFWFRLLLKLILIHAFKFSFYTKRNSNICIRYRFLITLICLVAYKCSQVLMSTHKCSRMAMSNDHS